MRQWQSARAHPFFMSLFFCFAVERRDHGRSSVEYLDSLENTRMLNAYAVCMWIMDMRNECGGQHSKMPILHK